MLIDDMMHALRQAATDHGSIGQLARMTDVSKASLARWLAGTSRPNIEDICHILDTLGYRLEKINGTFVDERPRSRFISVPIIRNPSLLRPGFLPADNIDGWCAVEKDFESVRNRSDLIVIQMAGSAMEPLIADGSLLLIDREDRAIASGHIYLVRTPQGCTLIRRVMVSGRKISFVHDNPDFFDPCLVYDINKDYAADPTSAIIGRAIWMRGDISQK